MNWNPEEEEEHYLSLSRFEAMLKTNKVFFFDSEEFEEIVLYYLDTGKTNLAKRALKLGLEQHPKSTGLRLVQVEMLVYENHFDTAEQILNELHNVEPTNEEIYIQKANVLSKKGEHQKAVELLETALNYTDDYADVYSLIGMEYLFMDKLEAAKEYFIKCLQEDKDDYSALYNVMYCFDFLEQRKEAVEFLNSFIDENPYSEVAWHQLGIKHYELKEYELAVRAFDFAIVIDESFLGAYMEKAKSLEHLKKYKEAIVCYNHTLDIDDPTPYAYLRIGKCFEELGNKDKAIRNYRKVTVEDPTSEKGWQAIIDLHIKEGKFKRALNYIDKALDIDNENELYWTYYANVHYELKNYEEAFKGYGKAIDYGTSNLDVFLIFADMNMILGEYREAVRVLMQVSEIYSENSEIEYRLAGLNFLLKKELIAKFHLSNALITNFDNHSVLSELFPKVFETKTVQKLIEKHKNPR